MARIPAKQGGKGFKHRSEDGDTFRQNKMEARGAKKYYTGVTPKARAIGARTLERGMQRGYNSGGRSYRRDSKGRFA